MKILAIRYSGLGDLVMLLPALQRLRSRYADCHVTLLTDRSNRDFPELSDGLVDAVVTLDRRRLKCGLWAAGGELISFIRRLRSTSYDLVVDFHNFGETATISYLAKAPVKRGAPKKPKYHYGYTERVERVETDHRSQFFCRIAGVDGALGQPKLSHDEPAGVQYAELLKRQLSKELPILGLNLGSTQESRRWHHENFAQLARQLEDRYQIVVFVGPGEHAYAEVFNESCHVVKGVTIPQLCGAISQCDFFISNDTGPVHLAGALDVPTLTLFSTGEDWQVGALARQKRWIRQAVINDISVDTVILELESLRQDCVGSKS